MWHSPGREETMRSLVRIVAGTTLALGIAAMVMGATNTPAPDPTPKPLSPKLQRGRQIFIEFCAMCHGEDGSGDGDFGVELKSKSGVSPANLTDRGNLQRLGRGGVRRVIAQGGAHTGRSNFMPSWGERLTPHQIDDVASYVYEIPELMPGISAERVRAYTSAPPGIPAEGHRLFLHHCAACHGMLGHGDGPLAAGIKAKAKVSPRNLTDTAYMGRMTDRDLFMTVSLGGGHMGKSPYMPVWAGYLKPDQIKDLVSYIRAISHTPTQP
jgi:mono/diheme cytochrome c family protein